MLGAAATIRAQIETVIAPCERADHDRVETRVREALGDDAFDSAFASDGVVSLDDVLALFPAPASRQQERAASPVAPDAPPESTPRDHADRRARGAVVASASVSAPLVVRALGAGSVSLGERLLEPSDWGYAKPRELLFLLAGSEPQTKGQIGDSLWPSLSDRQLRNAFHTALRDLRRALGDPAWVAFAAGRYGLDLAREHSVDIEDFEDALAQARRAKPASEALPHLQRAIAVYQGDFVPDLDSQWATDRRVELRRGFAAALSGAGRLLVAAQRFREAAAVYRRVVAEHPLDESGHRQLIGCLTRLGEPGQAAQVYRQLAERLRDELGVSPAPETTALAKQLGRGR